MRSETLAMWASETAFPGPGNPLAYGQGVVLRVPKHPLIVYFIDFCRQKFNFLEFDR